MCAKLQGDIRSSEPLPNGGVVKPRESQNVAGIRQIRGSEAAIGVGLDLGDDSSGVGSRDADLHPWQRIAAMILQETAGEHASGVSNK